MHAALHKTENDKNGKFCISLKTQKAFIQLQILFSTKKKQQKNEEL